MILLYVCPVYAAATPTLLVNPSITLLVDNARSVVQSTSDGNYYDVSVPLYVGVNADNKVSRTYLSGSLRLNGSLTSLFRFTDSNNSNLAIQYIEPASDFVLFGNPEYNLFTIHFNNLLWDNATNNQYQVLVGFLHFSFNYSANNTNIYCTSNSVSPAINNNYLYFSDYEYGLTSTLVYAIDHSTDIESIITLLGSLDNDLLNVVVPQLQNINGILGQIYNYLQTLNANQTQNFRQLVYALSGVDLSTTSSSNLSQTTYDRWVHLIYDAINYQEPNASEADQAANDLQSAHDQNDLAQDAAYQGMDSAMESIDFNVTVPQGIINAGLTIGNYIESIYSNLGSDLQFLITVTLTIGLITVIIGAINRYPRSPVTDSVSEVETSGIKNGKKVHSKTTTYRHTTRVRK